MHAKNKGTIGELAVAKDLSDKGFYVFSELGDLSRIDLIAECPETEKLYKIQVKYVALDKNGCAYASLRKSGPNYRFVYEKGNFDIMAVYCPDIDKVAYIHFDEFGDREGISLRITPSLNKGGRKATYFSDRENIKNALENKERTKNQKTYDIVTRHRKTQERLKFNWPENKTLEKLIRDNNYNVSAVSRILKVSGNGLRKHCKRQNIMYEGPKH